jgi:hypothetical protein
MKTLDRFEFMRLFVRIAEIAVSPRPPNRWRIQAYRVRGLEVDGKLELPVLIERRSDGIDVMAVRLLSSAAWKVSHQMPGIDEDS